VTQREALWDEDFDYLFGDLEGGNWWDNDGKVAEPSMVSSVGNRLGAHPDVAIVDDHLQNPWGMADSSPPPRRGVHATSRVTLIVEKVSVRVGAVRRTSRNPLALRHSRAIDPSESRWLPRRHDV
jgi:hypothetical protein